MTRLDYPNTCPTIEHGISEMEDNLDCHIKGIVEELCPLYGNSELCQRWVTDTVKWIMQDLEPIFERVRSSNENLRSAADNRISELCDDIDDLEDIIEELKETLDNVCSDS